MPSRRKIRFIEPQGRPERPLNAWIGHWPLLGPIILASVCERNGHDVAVYNENILGPVTEHPRYQADLAECDVVCLTIMTPTASRGYEIARQVRRMNPRAVIAMGGSHATFMPQEAIQHADIVCRGEGEGVIEAIASGQITSGIVEPPAVADLDSIARPNFELVAGFDRLMGPGGRARYELPMMTSRGCPHGCTYCSVTRMFGRQVRRQSLQRVCADVEAYATQGFGRLMFYDDNFVADPAFTTQLMNRLTPLGLRFNSQVRADFMWTGPDRRIDQPLLDAMRRGGGDVLYVGFETIDASAAKQWNKGYAPCEDLAQRHGRGTQILHDNGFWVHGMFVLGPQHGRREADGIVNFARRTRMESIQVSVMTPLPGTPMYTQMKPHLVLDNYPADWDYYDGAHCVYDHGLLGPAQLTRTLFDLHRNFYGLRGISLRRMLTSIRRNGSLEENLRLLYDHVKLTRRTLRLWQQEIAEFVEVLRERLAQRVGPADA